MTMPLLIGIGLALALAAFARLSGLDRDRAFYTVVLIVVGHYYVLFAVVAGAGLPIELLGFAVFAAIATLGFRTSLWLVAAGLALHGLFDFLRAPLLAGHGAPLWWPAFCAGFDLAAALILAAILRLDRRPDSVTGHQIPTSE